jgi:hypothetical protein
MTIERIILSQKIDKELNQLYRKVPKTIKDYELIKKLEHKHLDILLDDVLDL